MVLASRWSSPGRIPTTHGTPSRAGSCGNRGSPGYGEFGPPQKKWPQEAQKCTRKTPLVLSEPSVAISSSYSPGKTADRINTQINAARKLTCLTAAQIRRSTLIRRETSIARNDFNKD